MRAAYLVEPKKPLEIRETPAPVPAAGEALVKIAACGLCRTDHHYIEGTPTFKKPPLILGHEISGTVEAFGPGGEQSGIKAGDQVLLPPVLPCGHCQNCLSGRGTLCTRQVMLGNHRDGGFAEFIALPAFHLFKLPAGLPLKECSVVADAVTTAYHAVVNRGGVRPGWRVAVFGCGGVGLNVVQMAAAAGAEVFAVDLVEEKIALAKRLGASAGVNAANEKDTAKSLRSATDGGVDVAFEVIGNPKVLATAFDSVKWGGRVVAVGYSQENATIASSRLMFREVELVGSLGCGTQDFPRVLNLLKTGKVKVDPLVSHRFPLEKINDGFDLMEKPTPDFVRAITVIG